MLKFKFAETPFYPAHEHVLDDDFLPLAKIAEAYLSHAEPLLEQIRKGRPVASGEDAGEGLDKARKDAEKNWRSRVEQDLRTVSKAFYQEKYGAPLSEGAYGWCLELAQAFAREANPKGGMALAMRYMDRAFCFMQKGERVWRIAKTA